MSELLTPSRISALLREHGLRPRQALGQNFLADPNQVRRIVALSGIGPGDRVLEIGPGLGSLTRGLIDAGAEVVAVEADPAMAEVCAREAPEASVHVGDALRTDLTALTPGAQWACVSSLPYNVAVPVVVRILEEVPSVDRMLVMVQAEVAQRLVARPGEPLRAAVSVKVEYYGTAQLVGRVPATVFIPAPSVESALVSIRRQPPQVDSDPAWLFSVVRAAFGQRRKTLRNALAPLAGSPSAVEIAASRAGVQPSDRAEALSLEQFAALAAALRSP